MVLVVILLTLASLWLLVTIIVFIFADADLRLMFKISPPEGFYAEKVVWITGASQGIGESLAIEFAKLGSKLILSSRSVDKLQLVKRKCLSIIGEKNERRIEILPFDLSSGMESIRNAVRSAEALFNGEGVHCVVHNAGHPRPKMTCEESDDLFLRSMFEVNVFAPIELTRSILPRMIQRGGGQFVVVSSVAGKVPSPTQGVYAATKHAVNGYFHTLYSEFVEKGIRVTVACPGPIATPAAEGDSAKGRMTSERCAQLIVCAAGHELNEAWISPHPVLLFLYVMQYLPRLGFYMLTKIGPKRVRALREGGTDLYNANLLFGSSAEKKTT